MTRRPETRYAWNGDVALAFQVFGAGPVDLVYLQGYVSHVDLNWESQYLARFLRGLGERARVIHTDRRGWGCSDRFSPGDVAPLEVQVDDLVAVMDAAGSERAVIFTSMDTCPTGVLFAATYPERTAGLVLVDPMLAFYDTEEARRGVGRDQRPRAARVGNARLGLRRSTGTTSASTSTGTCRGAGRASHRARSPPSRTRSAPSTSGTCSRRSTRRRSSSAPGGRRATRSRREPRRARAQAADPGLAPDRAAGQGGASWHHWYARGPAILAAVGDLIASIREEQESFDRVLATVLFTDIVDSTATAAVLGDAKWRKLIDEHDRIGQGDRRPLPGRVRPQHRRRPPGHVRRPGPGRPLRPGDHRGGAAPGGRDPGRAPHRRDRARPSTGSPGSASTSGPGWGRWPGPARSGSAPP